MAKSGVPKLAEGTEHHETEHEHRSADDKEKVGDAKKGIGAELKKRPWLWLVITVGAGIVGWIVYEKLFASSSSATATPTTTGDTTGTNDDGGGASGGGGNPDDDEETLDQLLAAEQAETQALQALSSEIGSLYSPPPTGPYTSLPEVSPKTTKTTTSSGTTVSPQTVTLVSPASPTSSLQITAPAGAPNNETLTNVTTGATAKADPSTGLITLESKPSESGPDELSTKTQAKTESSLPKAPTAGSKTIGGSKLV